MARKRKKAPRVPRFLLFRVSLLSYALGAIGCLVVLTGVAHFTRRSDRLSKAIAAASALNPVTVGPNLPGENDANITPLVIVKHPPVDPDWEMFHPAWTKFAVLPVLPLRPEATDKIEAAGQQIATLVDDPKNRIDTEFKVPSFLRNRVMFWMQVYAQFNSHTRIVHDRNNPAQVYGYIDFRSVYRASTSNAEAEHECNHIEKRILKGLKERLLEAVGASSSGLLSADEKAEIQVMLSQYGSFSVKNAEATLGEVRTQSGQSDMFLLALYRSRNLLPHIESVFRQQGLPVGLARIPFVESSFNYHANSKGGAVGIWQFMPETAKQMIHGDEEKAWSDPLEADRERREDFRFIAAYYLIGEPPSPPITRASGVSSEW